jgi:uncharacterized protein YjbI with pentapeptide repeats
MDPRHKAEDDNPAQWGAMTIGRLRQGTLVVLAALLGVAPAGEAQAADLTAREVTALLFNGGRGASDLAGKDLRELDLAGLDFKGARMAEADLYGADLTGANLAAADLRGARLDRATIIKAEFSSADLEGATILRPNASSSFATDPREAPRFAGARLTGATLVVRLVGADFRWADLSRAVFGTTDPRREVFLTSQVILDACDFSEATLNDARLPGASLRFARFERAAMRGVDLRGADLTRADFSGADLTGADVAGANLDEANFASALGLSEIKGLALARNADRAVMANGR